MAKQSITVSVAGREQTEHLFSWYTGWDSRGRRTFWGCFLGWMLDGVDVQLYGFVIPTLMVQWHLSGTQAGSISTTVLISSSVGGWIGGILSDRIGRVRTMQIAVIWFSVFSFLAAFTNNYQQLIAVRALHGLGFGAEWAAGAALIAEIIPDKYRGRAGGSVHSAWGVGWALAALLYGVCFSLFDPEIAWRVLFAIGLLPCAFVIYVQKFVEESPLFIEQKKKLTANKDRPRFWSIFSPALLRRSVLGALLCVGIQGGGYTIGAWLPTFLKIGRDSSVLGMTSYMLIFTVIGFFGYAAGGYFSDRYGRRLTFGLFAALTTLMVLLYVLAPMSKITILILTVPLGFVYACVYGSLGAFLNELFPTAVRGSGIGFCFNFGRAIGAVSPTVVGFLTTSMTLGEALAIMASGAYGFVVLIALLLPETKGTSLRY